MVEPSTEDAGSAVTDPALLVVHPKIGALFIDGLLPLGALMAARPIRTAVPEAPVATELLVNFCLAAATADTTSSAQSELSVLSSFRHGPVRVRGRLPSGTHYPVHHPAKHHRGYSRPSRCAG